MTHNRPPFRNTQRVGDFSVQRTNLGSSPATGRSPMLVTGLPRVLDLDRARVRQRAVARFGVDRMVDEYVALYAALAARPAVGA